MSGSPPSESPTSAYFLWLACESGQIRFVRDYHYVSFVRDYHYVREGAGLVPAYQRRALTELYAAAPSLGKEGLREALMPDGALTSCSFGGPRDPVRSSQTGR